MKLFLLRRQFAVIDGNKQSFFLETKHINVKNKSEKVTRIKQDLEKFLKKIFDEAKC